MSEINNIQNVGLKRDNLDKFYTKSSVVKECINLIKENIQIKKNDMIIEPSAGNGAFIKKIKKISKNYKFYDIKPENKEIEKQDYLDLDYDEIKNNYNNIHIIGNPPFGRQSSLAIKFIKKSCNFCDTLSFILPKSFKKISMQKAFPLNFHLICNYDLPEKSFLVNDEEYDVPCVFQIWQKKDENRVIPKIIKPKNYIFVKKEENPDISVRRVGVNAGNISKDIDNKSIQSHYFIKIIDRNNIENKIEKLKKIKYEFNNTVGPKSLSKQELIAKYNEIL